MKLRGLESIVKGMEEEELRGYHLFSSRSRREIFREITRRPCINAPQISKATGMNASNVIWHIRKLMKEDYVGSYEYRSIVFYPRGLVKEEDLPLFSFLNTRSGNVIVRALFFDCKGTDELLQKFSRATLYRNLKVMQELRILEQEKGKKRLLCLTESFYKKLEEYDKIGIEFKRQFLEKLAIRGYDVDVIGIQDYEMKVRVTGKEKFTLGIYISPLRTSLGVFE